MSDLTLFISQWKHSKPKKKQYIRERVIGRIILLRRLVGTEFTEEMGWACEAVDLFVNVRKEGCLLIF